MKKNKVLTFNKLIKRGDFYELFDNNCITINQINLNSIENKYRNSIDLDENSIYFMYNYPQIKYEYSYKVNKESWIRINNKIVRIILKLDELTIFEKLKQLGGNKNEYK